jgi:hypothetical protein
MVDSLYRLLPPIDFSKLPSDLELPNLNMAAIEVADGPCDIPLASELLKVPNKTFSG